MNAFSTNPAAADSVVATFFDLNSQSNPNLRVFSGIWVRFVGNHV
jgi:hypothetical protein